MRYVKLDLLISKSFNESLNQGYLPMNEFHLDQALIKSA